MTRWKPNARSAVPQTQARWPHMAGWVSVLTMAALHWPAVAQVHFSASQFAGQPNGVARTFPASAKRGSMEVVNVHEVRINGALVRLSPGSRIRSAANTLLTTGGLVGQTFLVNYTQDTMGQPHDIWILTEREAAEKRPGSDAVRTTNIVTETAR